MTAWRLDGWVHVAGCKRRNLCGAVSNPCPPWTDDFGSTFKSIKVPLLIYFLCPVPNHVLKPTNFLFILTFCFIFISRNRISCDHIQCATRGITPAFCGTFSPGSAQITGSWWSRLCVIKLSGRSAVYQHRFDNSHGDRNQRQESVCWQGWPSSSSSSSTTTTTKVICAWYRVHGPLDSVAA